MNKKGISPLIATVLIIGFTIALALVIFTWGKNFVTGITKETGEKANAQLSCINDVGIDFRNACYANGVVEFTLENKKDLGIDSFLIRVFGAKEDQVDTIEVNEPLTAFDIQKYQKNYNISNVGSVVTKLELIRPVIKKAGKGISCTDISKEYDVVEVCAPS